MKTTKPLIYSVLLFHFFFNSYSQTGPGGVGNSTNNALWLKGDAGTSTSSSGQPVSSWNDASGNSNNASQTNVNQQPLFASSVINNYPALQFDINQPSGQNDFLSGLDAPNLDNTNGLTIFSVVRPTTLGSARSIISKRNGTNNEQSYMLFFYDFNNYYVDLNGNNNRFNTSPVVFNANTNYLISTLYDATLSENIRVNVYHGETVIKTGREASTSIPDYNSPFVIGATHIGDNRGFGGYIAEVIVYRKALNTAERIIVNNYLSAKYDHDLAVNNIYTQDTSGGNFDHHVAGIGQASDGSNHTDSKGSSIVRISDPSELSNDEFLFWGEETRNPTYNFNTNTSNYTEQLNSKWRVSRQGDLGTVTMTFDISSMDLMGKPDCSELQLVVDDTYDFTSPTNVYDLTIVDNIATATSVQLPDGHYFSLRYADQIIWDGTSFFNGDGIGNAPTTTTLCSCLKLTIKSGTVTLPQEALVREVEIESGATLNVSNLALRVINGVVINGTLNLLGEAQLLQHHEGSSLNSGSGHLTVRQQGTTNGFNYNYWSSPVTRNGNWQVDYLEDATGSINFAADPDPNPATSTLSSRWLHTFNGTSGDYDSWTRITPTTPLSPGDGYIMKGSGSGATEEEYIFSGIPNDGTYEIPVIAGTDFLTGNPYPSVLDAHQFITDNLDVIEGPLYFWESFTTNNSHYLADYEGGYATKTLMLSTPAVADASNLTSGNGMTAKYAPTQYISVGQGFFTTIANSGLLTFNNDQRAFAREFFGGTVFYKTNIAKETIDERPKIWFSFTAPKGQIKTIGLGYDTHTTKGYDRGYDAKSYDNLKNDFYWLLNDEALVIQALPAINIQDDLPLGVKIADAGLYKFSINKMENVPSDLDIYLLDKNQNIYYNLRDAEAQLLLDKGRFDEFSIVFKQEQSLSTPEVEANNTFVSYDSNNKILELHTKQSLVDIESFEIYNTLGQAILKIETPESMSIHVNGLSNSMYFLKVNTKHNKDSKSIKFIKY